ncbi:hypothetical protein J5N97_010537 [Dioscorea zingiberensis]|uniref:SMP domain-containing protein n=1 Tax=Dioscorea zingiberensis TaxID=325984 RepID=A0A9D5D0B6_9LILI|nr:hypothetical protein J5N97_010537 [Dioscorea zingiberensis]
MSQQQPQRPQASDGNQVQPITYGDVFEVSGDLASQPISPQDAAMMESAETCIMGQTMQGGPTAVMQAAANWNEQVGFLGHYDTSRELSEQGVSVAETDLPGRRFFTEYIAGQYTTAGAQGTNIIIGEALEVSALVAGDMPVDQSDVAAIQAVEARATRMNVNLPGGVAAEAQSAADVNARTMRDEDKTCIGDVLSEATTKMPVDKPATREDAEKVMGAEVRSSPEMAARPGGVAASVVVAARLNKERGQDATELMPVDKPATREDAEKVEKAELRNRSGTGIYPGGVAMSIAAAAPLNEPTG